MMTRRKRDRQRKSFRSSLLRLTTERAAEIILFLLLFAMASRVAIDPDMWWHLQAGERSLETGEFVYADSFSHTFAGRVHKNHSWLAQVVMVAAWKLAGQAGLTLYVAALAVGGMRCLYRAGRGDVYTQSFVLVFGAACAAAFWSPRPQMFTFFYGALTLWILRDYRRGIGDRLWLIPPLLWLWGNMHGGYVLGFVIIAAFALGDALNRLFGMGERPLSARQTRKLLAFTGVALLCLPINPLGLEVYAAPLETLRIEGLREYIQEWQPPDFSLPATWSLPILLLMFLLSAAASRRRFDCLDWLLTLGALSMALLSARNLPLFALAATPIITTHWDALLRRKGWRLPKDARHSLPRVGLNALLVGAVGVGTIAHFAWVSAAATVNEAIALNYPVHAVERLERIDAPGKLFNVYRWGGYLIWRAPDYPVFIDGRSDLYRDFLGEYQAAATGTDAWAEVFARWDIAIALVETDGPLARLLDNAANWRLDHRDDLASLYLRRDKVAREGEA